MTNSYKFIFSILILFGLMMTTYAQGEANRIKKLSKGADVILTGKVSEKKSSWNADKTKIYTKATLQVDEYLKGKNNDKSVEITYPGGEVDGVGELYTHMPSFEANEEVLVFLKKDKKDAGYRVLDGEEGKIKVVHDKNTKEKTTRSNVSIKELKAQIRDSLTKE